MMIPSLATWFTPTVLFCVLNLGIAIIFIAANFKSSSHNRPGQLARSPSLLERVKSVNLSSFYAASHHDDDDDDDDDDQYRVRSETTEFDSMSQFGLVPSLLERVKSIDFSFSSFYSHDSDQHESERTRYDSANQLARAPSLLERVKSLKILSAFESDDKSGDTFSDEHKLSDADPQHDPIEDRNVTSVDSDVTPVRKSASNMTKSRSEKIVVVSEDVDEDVDRRRPATMRASISAKDECVDAKADDFIKRFKQQLRLQRLDSLKSFREMLDRGL